VIPTVFGTVSDQRSVRRTHPRGVSNIRPSQFVQRPLGSPRPMVAASPCPDWPIVRYCDSVPIRPILPIRPRRGCLTLCWKHSGIHLSRNRPPQDRPPCPRFSGDHHGRAGNCKDVLTRVGPVRGRRFASETPTLTGPARLHPPRPGLTGITRRATVGILHTPVGRPTGCDPRISPDHGQTVQTDPPISATH